MADMTADEQHKAVFIDYIRLVADFQTKHNIDLAVLAKAQIWALKETARQAADIEIDSPDDHKLVAFMIEHVGQLMEHISRGNLPCLH